MSHKATYWVRFFFLSILMDIANSSEILKFLLFADDTCIFLSNRNLNELEATLNKELQYVSDWLVANKLSLNIKNQIFCFLGIKNEKSGSLINTNINGHPLQEKEYAKCLGVVFDNKLTFEHHINQVNIKLLKGNAILDKIRNIIPQHLLIRSYNAYIQPHLNYGALVWGSSGLIHTQKLKRTQKNAIRKINFKSKKNDSTRLFIDSKVLPFDENIRYLQSKFIWQLLNIEIPQSIMDIFNSLNTLPKDGTVNAEIKRMNLPYRRTEVAKKFLTFNSIMDWNRNIPSNIKILTSKRLFLAKLKEFLLTELNKQ